MSLHRIGKCTVNSAYCDIPTGWQNGLANPVVVIVVASRFPVAPDGPLTRIQPMLEGSFPGNSAFSWRWDVPARFQLRNQENAQRRRS